MIETRGAIIRAIPGTYEVVDLELEGPRQGEVTVKMAAAGLCHTDHGVATGELPMGRFPLCGGHEGAGVVTEVGPGTSGFEEGDHVVMVGLPACGRCRWCASGLQVLCELGLEPNGARSEDPSSYRMSMGGEAVGQFSGLAAFSEYTTVSINQVRKISPDIPLTVACLVGCGVGTGWGAAVNSAEVRPGDNVVVIGVGGVGINAVQGAVHAGAAQVVAVDTSQFKLEKALEFGATHTASSIEEAGNLVRETNAGEGADAAIITVSTVTPAIVGEAFAATGKGGTTVVASLGDMMEIGADISVGDLVMSQKRLQGSLFGGRSTLYDCLTMLRLYQQGALKLDELVTKTYSLDQIGEGYEDLHAGKNLRGVIVFD